MQPLEVIVLLLSVLVIAVLTVLIVLLKNRPAKRDDYSEMNNMLKEAFTEFGDKIDKSLKGTIDAFGDKLTGMVMEVNLSSQVLDDTVNKFDESIKNLEQNMKSINEFNGNLGVNIDRMNENYKSLTDNLNSTIEVISSNFGALGDLSEGIKEAANEMTSYNKQIVQDMGSIAEEVKGSIVSIKDLGEVLKNDMAMRSEEAKEYQDDITQLIEKVTGDISLLGYNTANAFSKTIEETTKATAEKVLQDIITVADEIKGATTSIKEFGSALKNDLNERSNEAKGYQENIGKLMEQVSEEISLIGEKTATAFSQSLEESAKSTSYKISQDFDKMTTEIEGSVDAIKDLNEALKGDFDTRIEEAQKYHENITNLMLKISGEMSILGQNTTDAFSQSLEGSGQAISQKVTESIDEMFKGLLSLLDEFKENEKLLAKTIVMLPDQVITYNETAANKIGMQIDEVKRIFRNTI